MQNAERQWRRSLLHYVRKLVIGRRWTELRLLLEDLSDDELSEVNTIIGINRKYRRGQPQDRKRLPSEIEAIPLEIQTILLKRIWPETFTTPTAVQARIDEQASLPGEKRQLARIEGETSGDKKKTPHGKSLFRRVRLECKRLTDRELMHDFLCRFVYPFLGTRKQPDGERRNAI